MSENSKINATDSGENKPNPQNDRKIRLSTEPYKGVRDFYPADWAAQKYIFNTWKIVMERFGFVEYNASILEPAELYRAKSGEELINEQTYTFTDRGEREVTLRPEMTPSVARMVAAQRREMGFPARWYSIQNFFRYERPQRGRSREFWQLNADILGLQGTEADIESIIVADTVMKAFGAETSDYEIKVSSRKLLNALFNNWYQLDARQSLALQKLIDKKAKLPEEIFAAEAEKIVGEPFEFLNLTSKEAKSSTDYQEAMSMPQIREAKEELDAVLAALKAKGITNARYDETLIRGFDYYTGIVFEVFDTDPVNNRSLFGGGRFDELLGLFGGDRVPAVGFGMGDITIKDFLVTRNLMPKYVSTIDIVVCIMDKGSREYADEVAEEQRLLGKNVSVNYSYRPIQDQIKSAVKQNITQAIVIGEIEASSKKYKIRDISE